MIRTINIVIPDAGPLISLAKSGHLDLLLLFKPEVRVLIADAVAHEVTRFAGKYPDASVIARFIAENAPRVQVEKTELGATLIAAMQLWDTYQKATPEKKAILESAAGLKPENPPRNGGEAAILGLAREMTFARVERTCVWVSPIAAERKRRSSERMRRMLSLWANVISRASPRMAASPPLRGGFSGFSPAAFSRMAFFSGVAFW